MTANPHTDDRSLPLKRTQPKDRIAMSAAFKSGDVVIIARPKDVNGEPMPEWQDFRATVISIDLENLWLRPESARPDMPAGDHSNADFNWSASGCDLAK